MIQTIDALAQGAAELPPDQRFTLARRILASVEPQAKPEVEAAWAGEIRERIMRYDAGEIVGIPASEVFAGFDHEVVR